MEIIILRGALDGGPSRKAAVETGPRSRPHVHRHRVLLGAKEKFRRSVPKRHHILCDGSPDVIDVLFWGRKQHWTVWEKIDRRWASCQLKSRVKWVQSSGGSFVLPIFVSIVIIGGMHRAKWLHCKTMMKQPVEVTSSLILPHVIWGETRGIHLSPIGMVAVSEFAEHLKVHKFSGKTKVSEFQNALHQVPEKKTWASCASNGQYKRMIELM